MLAAGGASAGAASDRPLVDGFPYLEAEVTWAVERELAQTLDDVLVRRIRLAPELRDRGASIAPRVAAILGAAPRLGRRRGRPARSRPTSTAPIASSTCRHDRSHGDPRPRPGHHVVARHRLRPLGHAGRHAPSASSPGVPVAGPRHPRPRGHLDSQLAVAQGGRRGRRRRRSTSPRSASPTSARRPSCGTAPRAGRSPPRSSGRAGSPPRSANGCARTGHEPFVRERTGLPIDAYFSGPKIRHILEEGGLRARAERGELAFGTVDSWLHLALTERPRPRDRRLQRVAGRCCATSTRSTGTTTCCG